MIQHPGLDWCRGGAVCAAKVEKTKVGFLVAHRVCVYAQRQLGLRVAELRRDVNRRISSARTVVAVPSVVLLQFGDMASQDAKDQVAGGRPCASAEW